MADRKLIHFEVSPALLNDMTARLLELPAKMSRDLLNRIESDEVRAVYDAGIAKKPARKKGASKKKQRKKVAPTKRKS